MDQISKSSKKKVNENDKNYKSEKFVNHSNESSGNKKFRNVGLQTIMQTKDYVPPSVAIQHNLEIDEYPKLFAIPHNVTALVVICSIISALAFQENNMVISYFKDNMKIGIFACVICICVFGSLFLPDSLLRRPHPIFWRMIMSIAILYLLFITYMLFQDREDARKLLTFFDKSLGKPLPEKNYAESCEVFTDKFPFVDLTNIYDAFDNYLTAHLFGWYVKMLIVRNAKLCWILSILFEILEITFRHWLPNFWECWWDHIILDILGCNALGIWLGDLTCKYFEMKTYGWMKNTPAAVVYDNENSNNRKESFSNTEVKNEGNNRGSSFKNSLNFLRYFTPNYFVKHDWKIFSSFKRFYSFLWFIFFMNMVDLSNFFGKFVLWIPATHFILFIRVNIWAFLAMISTREYYEYISNKSCKRVGPFVWLAHLILFIEWSIIYKFSEGLFKEEFPLYVIYFWVLAFIIISTLTINLLVKDLLKVVRKQTENNDSIINLLDSNIEIEEL